MKNGGKRSWKLTAAVCALLMASVLAASCGGAEEGSGVTNIPEVGSASDVLEEAIRFLDACRDGATEEIVTAMHPEYIASGPVPASLTLQELHEAMDAFDDYALEGPARSVARGEDAAEVLVRLGQQENLGPQLFRLGLTQGPEGWKVRWFDAMHWPGESGSERVIESALTRFLDTYKVGDGALFYSLLSTQYIARRELAGPPSTQQLWHTFGEPTMFLIPREEIRFPQPNMAVASVRVYYRRADPAPETRKIRLVVEGADWKVDDFPFYD